MGDPVPVPGWHWQLELEDALGSEPVCDSDLHGRARSGSARQQAPQLEGELPVLLASFSPERAARSGLSSWLPA